MPTKADAKARILSNIADAFEVDYRGHFKKSFDYAYIVTNQEVVPASVELRNAFDHFSLAMQAARQLSRVTAPAKRRDIVDRAMLEVIRGRRHISAGYYYAIEFGARRRINITRSFIEDWEHKEKQNMQAERRELYDLTAELTDIPPPSEDLWDTYDRVLVATNETYAFSDRMLRVADKLDKLYSRTFLKAHKRHRRRLAQIAYFKTLPFWTLPE